jgi:hypothetical protein
MFIANAMEDFGDAFGPNDAAANCRHFLCSCEASDAPALQFFDLESSGQLTAPASSAN